MDMNSSEPAAHHGFKEVESVTSRMEQLQTLANEARSRLAESPKEETRRKAPGAIAKLPLARNPVTRFIGKRRVRSATLAGIHRKIRRTRDLLLEAGMSKKFAEVPIESFPWHCVEVDIALSFAELLQVRYPNTKSRHNLLGVLRAILRECALVDLISASERDRVLDCLPLTGHYERGKGRELTDVEITKLLTPGLNVDSRLDLRNRAIITVFLSTGLRISEVAEIEVRGLDLDPEVRSIIVNLTKNGSSRVVWIPRSALAIMNEWIEKRGDHPGALFDAAERPGVPLSTASISRMLKTRADLSGITEGFSSHDFRRTVATRALRNDVDVFTVKRLLGHKNVQSTLVYDRRSDLEDRAVVEMLNLPGLFKREKDGNR